MRLHLLAFGEKPGVRSQHLYKSLNFRLRRFLELYEIVALLGRKEIEGLYPVERRVNAVYAAYALHEPRGIPGNIVVNNRVGAVKVDAFRENIGGHDNPVVVPFLEGSCIKVVDDGLPHAPVRLTAKADYLGINGGGDLPSEILRGLPRLGEDDELSFKAGMGREDLLKSHPFRIAVDSFPKLMNGAQDFKIVLQVTKKHRPEVLC